MKSANFLITIISLFTFFSLVFTDDISAQPPGSEKYEVHLWEHSNYGGGLYQLNVNDCMRDCSYANNQWKDQISSFKVPDGYVLFVYNGNGHQFVGNAPELYCTGWTDHWDNVNNGFGIKKQPAGWDAPANFPTGIYRFFSPYEGQYLSTGTGDLEDGQIAKHQNGLRQPENSNNAYNFLLIRDDKTNDYTIVSLETGRNWRPEGSGKQHFSMKEGTPLRTNHFNNADTWSNFVFEPVGMVDIGRSRRVFNIKTKGSDDYYVTLPCRERGTAPTFEKGGKNLSQQWEIQLVEALPELNSNMLKLITEKDENVPDKQQFTMLEFMDEETTVPHKKMSMKVPFYAVNDNKYGFKKRMKDYPIYILEREEFVVRKGSNKGWTENRRDKDIEFTVGTSNQVTTGSSISFNLGTSFSYSQEVGANGIFFNTKTTWSIGVTMGFDKSWHSSHTQTLSTSTKEYVSPCTKAALFGLATKITVRRADSNGNPIDEAPMAQWTYYDKHSIIYDALPLHPDNCKTLSPTQRAEKLATWKQEYEPSKPLSTTPSTPPTTTISTPNTVTPPTSMIIQQLTGKYQFQPASNGWHTGNITLNGNQLRWTNDAGKSWGLEAPASTTATAVIIPTNAENPYYNSGQKNFEFILENGQVKGFRFQNQLYHRVAPSSNILQQLAGKYQFQPASNGWHTGNITLNGNQLRWTNDAGKSWGLEAPTSTTATAVIVPTTTENPYYNSGQKNFDFILENGQVKGFRFQNQLYHRVGDH